MTNKTKLFKLCKMIMSFKEYETEKGLLILDGEVIEGTEISTLDENGEVVPCPDGEYEIEGIKITVADGKISEVIKEEEPTEETEEETKEEEVLDEPEPEPEPVAEEPKEEEPTAENPELEEAKRRIEDLEAKLAEAEARIAELEAELNKPVEEPLEMKAVAKPAEEKSKIGALKYFD